MEETVAAVRFELERGGINQDEAAWADAACISRFLRARNSNVPKATKLLRACLKWRKSFGVASIKADEFPDEFASGKMYVAGHDKQGRPVLVTRKKADRIQAGQQDRYLRHLVFTLEAATALMGPGVEDWVWIMDLAGYSRENSPPLNVSYATMKILADYYPERLMTAFIVDAPSVFYYLWKVLAPFIDSVTKEKIRFVYSKDLPPTETPAEEGLHTVHVDSAVAKRVDDLNIGPFAKDAFSPYLDFYHRPYDEQLYRALLPNAFIQRT